LTFNWLLDYLSKWYLDLGLREFSTSNWSIKKYYIFYGVLKSITFAENEHMKVAFYLSGTRKKNLYCRVSDGKERFTLSLGKNVEIDQWDQETESPKADFDLAEDLKGFKSYLEQKYHELKLNAKQSEVLPLLKAEAIKLFNNQNEPKEEDWIAARARLHDLKHAHPAENYLKAFLKFSGAKMNEIKYKPIGGHMLVLYEDTTYMISHGDDFKEDYKHYFEKESYDEIYTETPAQMWDHFLSEVCPFETDELMVELYRAWHIYWDKKRDEIKGGEQRYERFRTDAFRDLQIFFQTLQVNSAKAIENASSINDLQLIPLIAMTVYESYDDKDEFYAECVTFIEEYGSDYITGGDTFEVIGIDEDNDHSDEWYYVYNPMFEFDD